jgi:hypothetical protein
MTVLIAIAPFCASQVAWVQSPVRLTISALGITFSVTLRTGACHKHCYCIVQLDTFFAAKCSKESKYIDSQTALQPLQ